MTQKPQCRHKQILDASANWCNILKQPVNDTNECVECKMYQKIM